MGDHERVDPAEVAERLHAVLAEVAVGEVTAELDHAAYLRGAADALALLAADSPDSIDSGRQAGDG